MQETYPTVLGRRNGSGASADGVIAMPEVTVAHLIVTCRSRFLDGLRSSRRRRRRDELVARTDAAAAPIEPGTIDHGDAVAALATLSDDQRAALVLRYVDELAVADVAARLGRSVRAAESLLARRTSSTSAGGMRAVTRSPPGRASSASPWRRSTLMPHGRVWSGEPAVVRISRSTASSPPTATSCSPADDDRIASDATSRSADDLRRRAVPVRTRMIDDRPGDGLSRSGRHRTIFAARPRGSAAERSGRRSRSDAASSRRRFGPGRREGSALAETDDGQDRWQTIFSLGATNLEVTPTTLRGESEQGVTPY